MAEQDPFQTPPDREPGHRRKRPPVTIDLEAEAATPEPSAAAASVAESTTAGAESSAAAEPETIREHIVEADPLPESVPSEPRLLRYWVPALAAFGGAIVGGLLVSFLMAPAGNDPVATATIDSRFDTLTAKLNSLEAIDTQPSLDPKRLDTIEAEVAKLKQAPASAPPAAIVDLKPIENRIATLEAKPSAPNAAPVDLSPLTSRINALAGRMDALEAHPPVDPKTEAAARTIAVTTLRQAAEGSGIFASELAAAKGLGLNAPAIDTLQPLAAQSTPSRSELIAAYPAISDAIRAAAAKVDPDSGFFAKLAASAGTLVTVKPAGPMPGTSNVAVLSRVDAAVKAGDLSAALREGRDFDAYTRPVFADWAAKAKRRVDIDAALADLATASTSN